jgi:hypothetical protein
MRGVRRQAKQFYMIVDAGLNEFHTKVTVVAVDNE